MISRRALIATVVAAVSTGSVSAGGNEDLFVEGLQGDSLFQATVDKLIEGANDLRFERGEATMTLEEEFEIREVYEDVKDRLANERNDPYSLRPINQDLNAVGGLENRTTTPVGSIFLIGG